MVDGWKLGDGGTRRSARLQRLPATGHVGEDDSDEACEIVGVDMVSKPMWKQGSLDTEKMATVDLFNVPLEKELKEEPKKRKFRKEEVRKLQNLETITYEHKTTKMLKAAPREIVSVPCCRGCKEARSSRRYMQL